VLAILGWSIERKEFSTGKGCVWVCISGLQIDHLGPLSCGTDTSCGGWHLGRRWRRLWSRLSESVRGRCACSFGYPSCLRILCHAIWATKASGRLVLTKHGRVSFYRSLHLSKPRRLNTLLLLLSDLGTRLFDQELRFHYCGAWTPSLAIFATFMARGMSDCSNCTRPPCLAIVADMFKTYKK